MSGIETKKQDISVDSNQEDVNVYSAETSSVGKWQSFVDSFKPFNEDELDPNLSEVEKAMVATAQSPLSRSLKNRHIQMIAIGGAIGTGLFVGSGSALRTGGPAALLIAWGLIGSMLFCTVHALGELSVAFPLPGAFATYCTKFIDPSWGFAIGWNYAGQWLIVLPLELVAASITIKFWNSSISSAAWVAIFYVLIMSINLFGVKGYGEAEFIFSSVKVIAIIGFFILGIVLICGGGPNGDYIGSTYWHTPGAFAHGFKGVASVFVTAAFSFNGTELVGLTAAETANPRKVIPTATKQVFWRILLFYMVSLCLIGFLVPYTEKRLISSSSADASASPFVLAIKNAGIKGLPSLFNVVIMIAVLSVGNSAVYACSRTVAAMAKLHMAPKCLGYIDRRGRPLYGIALSGVFGLLCFLAASPKEGDVFTWLYAITGLSCILTWGSTCFCHIRFRYALKKQGRSTEELSFKSHTGVIGSYYGLGLNILVLIAQFCVALFPIGASPDAGAFFEAYLCVPVVLAIYIGHKLWTRNWRWYIRSKDMDLDTGRREFDLDVLKQEIAEETEYLNSKPAYYRFYKFWC